ncbi:MAG: carboxypeptidase-like regulatory domain-containing protein [Acidobacteriia bacterium]|nr:carboxypeptidase-like regulatory domain-containing protein [Terriglobia bacterium]
MKHVLLIFAFGLLFPGGLPAAQTSAPAPAPAAPSTKQAPRKRPSHADDFLIRGTVFNDKALALPGAEIRIRRNGDKKFRWETLTNSRGEFAVRVPRGADYELNVRAKGFAAEKKELDAKSGAREENTVFRLTPAPRGKTGAKK